MEKEQNLNQDNKTPEPSNKNNEAEDQLDENKENLENLEKNKEKLSPEEKIKELEDKLTRTFAEMENQRRRFEKEKDEAFDYGGFNLCKGSLKLN